jgi:hypothetical protein
MVTPPGVAHEPPWGSGGLRVRSKPRHRRRVFPQSSSNSRFTAGASGFLNLSQSRERPET